MSIKFYYIILFILLAITSAAQPITKVTVPYKQLSHVKAKKLSLDIYHASPGAAKPVLVFVHGGAWFLGDKATKIKNKIALCQQLGFVFVSVNYRLSSFFNKNIQYPVHVEDVADAVKWVADNISRYGGDEKKIGLMGHSAGAQMISLLATSEDFLQARGVERKEVKGIISIDTEGYDVYGMGKAGSKIYKKIFGQHEQTWKNASPILQVKPGIKYPDFLIVMRGKPYRFEMAKNFADKLRSTGTKVELISGEPYSHFKVNNAVGSSKDNIVTPKIATFLKEVFK